LIIYGASSSLGTFAIKLARASNIHPIIAISGSSSAHLTPLLDETKGDVLIDYRVGVDEMKREVKEKLGGVEVHHALDAISSKGTWIPISQMLSPLSEKEVTYLSVVSGSNKYDEAELGEGVTVVYTYCGTVHAGAYRPGMPKQGDVEEVKSDPEFGYLLFRYLARMLADGRFSGHPFVVVDGGLEGVGDGLNMLKAGKARGNKFVFKIGDV
jgi:NADPH:quinone reductase